MFAPFLLFAAAASPPPAVSVDALRRHVEVLAADDFEGRAPGTQGEAKTLAYISAALAGAGLVGAMPDGGWYQAVPLVQRTPLNHRATFRADSGGAAIDAETIVLSGRGAAERLTGAPVVFVGHGVSMPDRGVDQLAGATLDGAVALILYDGPELPGFPSYAERLKTVTAAGAAAVIGIVGDDVPWSAIEAASRSGSQRLRSEAVARIQGAMPAAVAARLFAAAGESFEARMNEMSGPSFRAMPLALRADIEVSTQIRDYASHNLVAKLPGRGKTGESLVYLAHWDHLGICRPEGAEDRICNGAVDNASGIAAMIEIADAIAKGPRPERDVIFLATTAEEIGLLGAEYFATNPPVAADSIVAAINLDTVAVHGPGEPVAVIGRGIAPLDALIRSTALELGRTMDETYWADVMVTRQDGWALTRNGIPTVMIGGSMSPEPLQAYLKDGPYHQPGDELEKIRLDGAAEDAALLIAIGRRLADPAQYRRTER